MWCCLSVARLYARAGVRAGLQRSGGAHKQGRANCEHVLKISRYAEMCVQSVYMYIDPAVGCGRCRQNFTLNCSLLQHRAVLCSALCVASPGWVGVIAVRGCLPSCGGHRVSDWPVHIRLCGPTAVICRVEMWTGDGLCRPLSACGGTQIKWSVSKHALVDN